MAKQNNQRVGKTIKDILINGVVHEINEEDETIVILDIQGLEERRVMSSQRLKNAGIIREEQGFELHAREYELNGEVKQEYYISRLEDSQYCETIELVPNLDVSKFRRRPGTIPNKK